MRIGRVKYEGIPLLPAILEFLGSDCMAMALLCPTEIKGSTFCTGDGEIWCWKITNLIESTNCCNN